MMPPAPPPGTLIEIDSGRSIGPTTEMLAVAESLAALESPTVETVAVFATGAVTAELLTATIIGIVAAEAPAAIGPGFVHVTSCEAAPQVQPAALAEIKVNCGGSVSVMVIAPVVSPLPRLFTAKLKAPSVPAPNLPLGLSLIVRSGAKVTESVAELLAVLLSPNEATVAVLAIAPEADELIATRRGIVAAAAPGFIGPGLVQVTACPTAPQLHPAATAEMKVNCAGNVSVTVIAPPLGPAVDPLATLLTDMLKVPLPPSASVPLWLSAIRRSGMLMVAESLPEIAEAIPPPDTLTWFVCGDDAFAATFTATVIPGYVAPFASVSLRSQVFAPPLPGHVQPLPDMDTRVSPDATVSVTVTFALVAPAEGPLFTEMVFVAPC